MTSLRKEWFCREIKGLAVEEGNILNLEESKENKKRELGKVFIETRVIN